MTIRVLLADDHSLVRDGLRSMLAPVEDIEIVGEAEDGGQAVHLTHALAPDVVVMDIGMKGVNGIEATRQIVDAGLPSRVIALSMHSDRQYVSEMLKAGAAGYLLKDSAFDELVDAIRAVAGGRMAIADDVAGVVLRDYLDHLKGATAPSQTSEPGARELSPREREVLALIAEGKNTKECAATLGVSVKTIETHRRQIMDKLGVYNLAGLVKYALRNGIATLDD